MKILFFSDMHLRSQSDRPKWRTDDHYSTQFEELNEIAAFARLHKVDLILSGGDFFHVPSGSHALIADTMAWAKRLPCAFYSVVGNHDCHGYNVEENNNALNVLFESDLVQRLDGSDLIWQDKEKLIIRGIPAYLDPKCGNYLFGEQYKDFYKLVVSHNFIIPHEVPFEAILPSQVQTDANAILLGHYHQSFYHVEGNTQFLNAGSISRWSVNEQHTPTIILLDTISQKIERIPLTRSKPASEIFDLDSVREIKNAEMNLQSFVNSLESTKFDSIDIENTILHEGKKQGILKEIVDLSLTKIRKAKADLK